MQALPAKVTCSIPIAILFRRSVASLHYTLNYVQNIVPYGDFMDIPALFRSGISHKREILHKGICFVFRKWEPLPPFTKMPYDTICIIRHFLSFISQSIVIFILLSFPMPKGRRRFQCAKCIPKFFYKLNKYILLKSLVHLKIPN